MPPHAAKPALTPAFGIIEATPRQAFDPGEEAEFEPNGEAAPGQTLSGPAYADPALAESSAATQSLGPPETLDLSPLSTRPTERTPSVLRRSWLPIWAQVWLSDSEKRIYLGATLALASIALVLWIAGSANTAKRLPPPAPAKPADATLTVALKLNSVPAGARISVDGKPSTDLIELPRGDETHDVAIDAIGKLPWHLAYVPQGDTSLTVKLLDSSQPSAAESQPPTARTKRSAPKPRPRSPVLRVPDF
jgi:hypothetical protein